MWDYRSALAPPTAQADRGQAASDKKEGSGLGDGVRASAGPGPSAASVFINPVPVDIPGAIEPGDESVFEVRVSAIEAQARGARKILRYLATPVFQKREDESSRDVD